MESPARSGTGAIGLDFPFLGQRDTRSPRVTAANARLLFRAFAASVACSGWCAAALAQEPSAAPAASSERIALVYSAPPECPGDEAFRAEVRARATSDWEGRPGELARRIAVTVVLRGERYIAAIEFLSPQGDRVTRSVAGKSCGDVVNGIALVTALAIQSRVEEALEQSEPESSPPAAPPPEAPKPEPAPVPPPAAPRAEPDAESRTHLRLGAAAAVATGVGPVPVIGPAFFAAVEWDGPRLGVAGEAFWSGSVQANGVPARFRRLTARVEGCPVSFSVQSVAFEPCAFVELGSLRGDGELALPTTLVKQGGGASLWVAPGIATRFIVSFEPLLVSLEGTARVPVVQEKFGVVNAGAAPQEVYAVPAVAVGGALGLGIRL